MNTVHLTHNKNKIVLRHNLQNASVSNINKEDSNNQALPQFSKIPDRYLDR